MKRQKKYFCPFCGRRIKKGYVLERWFYAHLKREHFDYFGGLSKQRMIAQ
ncbi:MAG: hypothetical protein HRU07_00135 [Nitrosopumilus sp.]|nr:hypothetical protein [Nitrosopumilus sp.]NRA04589.1 hypothetical protein [Nitrosopumilus sp.]